MTNFLAISCYFGLLLTMFCQPCQVHAKTITTDTAWQGNVTLEEDIVIPAGITLTIKPGTSILVVSSDSTKTDPEYLSPLTEITVRGTLNMQGTPESPIVFSLKPEGEKERWAGILINGGQVIARYCRIEDAENALEVISGTLDAEHCTLRKNRYGLVAQGKNSVVHLKDSVISHNDYGLFSLRGAQITQSGVTISANAKKDVLNSEVTAPEPPQPELPTRAVEIQRKYGNEALLGETVWQGRIQVNGLIRLPIASRLIILPGTIIEFSKNDTNDDGLGENGLMIQGLLIAKGTPENPIIFRSAEKIRTPGSWDAINIYNSDGARNLIEYCRIEDAYRGLHFHFANVAVYHSVFTNNRRSIQFQESAVDIRHNIFFANNSAIQARDSEVDFIENTLTGNIVGANFFRTAIYAVNNTIAKNLEYGLKIREGFPRVANNAIFENRYGVMLQDTRFGRVNGNVIANNIESGLSLNTVDNTDINSNYIHGNGFNGINIKEARAVISDNHIADNGERGIGVMAFYGVITKNIFISNGHHIENEGKLSVAAPLNWFAEADPAHMIYDAADDPGRGPVEYMPLLTRPATYPWSLPVVPVNLTWYGLIDLPSTVTVPKGVTLRIAPGARIAFAEKASLIVHGRLLATGVEPDARIRFTSQSKRDKEAWGEVRLEHADGSILTNCDFEYATWALHSHFTFLPITGCRFANNHGGVRFRSGPLMINNSLFKNNTIGIRAFKGRAVIANNVITSNEKGIYVREEGSGLTITKNNIFANTDYNIRMGEFNNEDVDARGNWWGTENPSATIFDAHQEPGIGFVKYEPIVREQLSINIMQSPPSFFQGDR